MTLMRSGWYDDIGGNWSAIGPDCLLVQQQSASKMLRRLSDNDAQSSRPHPLIAAIIIVKFILTGSRVMDEEQPMPGQKILGFLSKR
jgi:hypothetical protein